jgi:hypothetical protein
MGCQCDHGLKLLRRHADRANTQLDDQELDRLLAAAVAEQRRRGRKPAESVETPGQPREAATVHLTPGRLNVFAPPSRLASNQRRSPGSSACPSPTCGRRWRAAHRGERRTVASRAPRPWLCRGGFSPTLVLYFRNFAVCVTGVAWGRRL